MELLKELLQAAGPASCFNVVYKTMRPIDTAHWWQSQGRDKTTNRPLSDTGAFDFIQGTLPILLVAHMDTVDDKPLYSKSEALKEKKDLIFSGCMVSNKTGILGADDRAGVWVLLNVYLKLKELGHAQPSYLFTYDEESGARGATAFGNWKRNWLSFDPNGMQLVMEFDRRGRDDLINYSMTKILPKKLRQWFYERGYLPESGSVSDISKLENERDNGLPMVNLSVGYEHEHTTNEVLHIPTMKNCVDLTVELLTSKAYVDFGPCEKKVLPTYNRYAYSDWYRKGNFGYDDDKFERSWHKEQDAKEKRLSEEELVDDIDVELLYSELDDVKEKVKNLQSGVRKGNYWLSLLMKKFLPDVKLSEPKERRKGKQCEEKKTAGNGAAPVYGLLPSDAEGEREEEKDPYFVNEQTNLGI